MRPKPKIYIAGPMYSSGDMDDNIRTALNVALEIRKAGGLPFIPHLYFFWNLMQPHLRKFWLELDEDWVRDCDALYRLEGYSEGGDKEVLWAKEVAIPIFSRIEGVLEFIKMFPILLKDEVKKKCPFV